MTEVSRSKTFTPSSMRGASSWSPRASAGAMKRTASGSTAAISRIDSAGVSRVMIMPGAITAPCDVVDAEGEVAVVRRPEQPGDERQEGEDADRGDLRPRDVRPHDVHPGVDRRRSGGGSERSGEVDAGCSGCWWESMSDTLGVHVARVRVRGGGRC